VLASSILPFRAGQAANCAAVVNDQRSYGIEPKAIKFEIEICDHLAENDWLKAAGDDAAYDRTRALFPADVIAWVQTTQPTAWDALVKNHDAKAADTRLDRIRSEIDSRVPSTSCATVSDRSATRPLYRRRSSSPRSRSTQTS